MAQIDVFDIGRNKIGQIDVSDDVFNTDIKEYLIHEAVKIQLANRRAGTASVKNRAAVAGGGKKPFRQKGTGQARQGCIRAPHYPGGGVAFGPKPKTYNLSMNKKARKGALRSALTLLYRENKLTVLDKIELDTISTKTFAGVLTTFDIAKTLVVIGDENRNLQLSARNIKDVKVLGTEGLNLHDIMKYKSIVFTQEAVRKVEGALQP
jgi:large subunit ribosomal protein L4